MEIEEKSEGMAIEWSFILWIIIMIIYFNFSYYPSSSLLNPNDNNFYNKVRRKWIWSAPNPPSPKTTQNLSSTCPPPQLPYFPTTLFTTPNKSPKIYPRSPPFPPSTTSNKSIKFSISLKTISHSKSPKNSIKYALSRSAKTNLKWSFQCKKNSNWPLYNKFSEENYAS